MNPYLWGVITGVVGLLLGMWIVKHPNDTRTYAQAVWQRISGLFKRKET